MADEHTSQRTEQIRVAIIHHLQRFPAAGDTPAGIVAYWLPQTGYEQAGDLIGGVVETMVAARELTRCALPDGGVLYIRGPALGRGE